MALEDILAQLDEEQANEVRDLLAAKDREAAKKGRDLSLATDAKLRETFPRAWRAYELKRLDFGDETDPDAIKAILKEKETELAELGVPISTTPKGEPKGEAKTEEPAQEAAAEEGDGSEAWGEPPASGSPSSARDLTAEFLEASKTGTEADRVKMAEILGEMNQRGAHEDITRLTELLSARPIMPRSVI